MLIHTPQPARQVAAVALLVLLPWVAGCTASSDKEPVAAEPVPWDQTFEIDPSTDAPSPSVGGGSAEDAEGGGSAHADDPASEEASAPPASGSAGAPSPSCGGRTADGALQANLGHLGAAHGNTDVDWTGDASDTSGYDACADLSWILVANQDEEPTPHQIMLFHGGRYLGTTLYSPTDHRPTVDRVDGDSLRVTYRFPREGEDAASMTGEAVSTFDWDSEQNKVVHAGDLPPGQG